jgi:hypothetical protein
MIGGKDIIPALIGENGTPAARKRSKFGHFEASK